MNCSILFIQSLYNKTYKLYKNIDLLYLGLNRLNSGLSIVPLVTWNHNSAQRSLLIRFEKVDEAHSKLVKLHACVLTLTSHQSTIHASAFVIIDPEYTMQKSLWHLWRHYKSQTDKQHSKLLILSERIYWIKSISKQRRLS